MTNVLWATPVPPDLAGGGGHIRQAHLLLALADDADVHLLCSRPVVDTAVRSAAASIRELEVDETGSAPRSSVRRRAWDVRVALGSTPREVAAFDPVVRAMAPVLASTPADIVLVEYAGLAPLVAGRRRGQRWLLTLHNLASVMASQEATVAPGRRQKWLYTRDARNARLWEAATIARYDQVVTVSEDDASALGGRSIVVPNGVDVDRFGPSAIPASPSVVFTGALYTAPNRDGIAWFCNQVWPLIRQRVPAAALAIVGSRPGADIARLQSAPGVTLHPDVPDVTPYLAAARVAVCPIRIGSGTRLKALEAMAAGRPVVGTTIGLGGLGLIDGQHAAFADDPPTFAASVCRALQDDDWATSLAAGGRRVVEECFDWRQIGRRFVNLVLSPP
jgi:glycosyltransferase involved in cell wall biosynthesis